MRAHSVPPALAFAPSSARLPGKRALSRSSEEAQKPPRKRGKHALPSPTHDEAGNDHVEYDPDVPVPTIEEIPPATEYVLGDDQEVELSSSVSFQRSESRNLVILYPDKVDPVADMPGASNESIALALAAVEPHAIARLTEQIFKLRQPEHPWIDELAEPDSDDGKSEASTTKYLKTTQETLEIVSAVLMYLGSIPVREAARLRVSLDALANGIAFAAKDTASNARQFAESFELILKSFSISRKCFKMK